MDFIVLFLRVCFRYGFRTLSEIESFSHELFSHELLHESLPGSWILLWALPFCWWEVKPTLSNFLMKNSIAKNFSHIFKYSSPEKKESNVKKHVWVHAFKNGPIFGRLPLKKFRKDMVFQSRAYPFKIFKGYLPQILFGPFLNIQYS